MKNFIWIINKEKIYAYIISVLTVVTLFVMSTMINRNLNNSEMTGANVVENVNQINEENYLENMESEQTASTENDIVPND